MRKALLVLVLPAAMLAACTVTVPGVDLAAFGDVAEGEDAVTPDPGTDPGKDPGRDPGKDEGGEDHTPPGDPGVPDDGPVDPGWDPGQDLGPGDTGTDLNETPQPEGYSCMTGQGCLSGVCDNGICRCKDASHCQPGADLWCDEGATAWMGTGKCLPRRDLFDGCKSHEHCLSGACDQKIGYCAKCADGGSGCTADFFCCGGQCAQGCLGCAVAPPPEPVRTLCMSGCFDPLTEYCGPTGPAMKLPLYENCRFNDSWCLTGYCMVQPDGLTSWCACRVDADCGGGGAVCINGGCAMS